MIGSDIGFVLGWIYLRLVAIVSHFLHFFTSLSPMDVTTAPSFARSKAFKKCKHAFMVASSSITRRDLVEKFLVAYIWPLSYGWEPKDIVMKPVTWCSSLVPYPIFGLTLPKGVNTGIFIDEVERRAVDIIGPCHENEHMSAHKLVTHSLRVNRVLSERGIEVEPCAKHRKPFKQMRETGATRSVEMGIVAKGKRRKLTTWLLNP